MAIEGLAIIGESINDSVPSTKKLFDGGDVEGILQLAKLQDEKGAAYLDVNVGPRPAEFMAEIVRKIQQVTAKPILNSISPLRAEMCELAAVQPFKPILLVSERVEQGRSQPCRTAEQTYQATRFLVEAARQSGHAFANDDYIIDPGIAPLASDAEGNLKRLIAAMERIHADPDLAGVHMSVGLSNFTVMLPPKRADGSPLKGPLQSAFLTKAMPLGLNMVVGSAKRRYALLEPEHPAMVCLEDCLKAEGFDSIMRVREFYT